MEERLQPWIEPPPGFPQRVLAAVEREAHSTDALPFPWKRLAFGAAAIVAVSTIGFAAGRSAAEGLVRAAGSISFGAWVAASLATLLLGGLIGYTTRLASR